MGKFMCVLLAVQLAILPTARGESIEIHGYRESSRGKREGDGIRIADGDDAEVDEFPSLAFVISDKNRYFCGATFITNSRLFTACHCLMKDPKKAWKSTEHDLMEPGKIEVVAGRTDINTKDYDENYYRFAKALKVHPYCEHEPSYIVYDFGLIDVAKPFKLMEGVIETFPFLEDAKVLITQAILHPDNLECVAVGWGSKKDSAMPIMRLRKINMTLMTLDWCVKTTQDRTKGQLKFIREMHTCSVGTGKNQTICAGDTGGPLLCGGENKLVVGVLSGYISGECGDDKNPAGWTRFDAGFDWVVNSVEPPRTEAPAPTTGAPGPTTGAPGPTTGAPGPTTGAPGPTSGAPGPTTEAPEPSNTTDLPASIAQCTTQSLLNSYPLYIFLIQSFMLP